MYEILWLTLDGAFAQESPTVDPLVVASELGLGVAASRGSAMKLDAETAAFFGQPAFRTNVSRASEDCEPLDPPTAEALVVSPGTQLRIEYENISDVALYPSIIAYQATGGFQFLRLDLYGMEIVSPREERHACIVVDDDPDDFVVRVAGVPDRDGWKVATSFEQALEYPTDHPDHTSALALINLFETDARQRTLLAALQYERGETSQIDSVLIRPGTGSDVDGLPEGTGMLVFTETSRDESLVAALYTSNRPPVVVALEVGADEVDTLADELVLAVAGQQVAERAPTRGDRALWRTETVRVVPENEARQRTADRLLPEPIRAALTEVERLVVLPYRGLSRIPWYALTLDGEPLVASHTIAVAPDLAMAQGRASSWNGEIGPALVVGDPRLRAEDYEGWTLPELPGAKTEARAVARVVRGRALLRRAATRNRVVKRARKADLIYLATHGVADAESPMFDSFLALNQGRWTAAEVIGEKLSARLAVLSACQTGLGRDIGAGTIGLARSFYQAGVPRVVMSLWSIDDEGTKELMRAFLGHLDDAPPAEALRRASDDLRRAGYPASGVEFVLVDGDGAMMRRDLVGAAGGLRRPLP